MDKTMDAKIEHILQLIKLFPEWGGDLIINLLLALSIIKILKIMANMLEDPKLVKVTSFLAHKVMVAIRSIFRGLFSAIESPIKRPRTKCFATMLSVIHSYVMSITFLCFFFGLVFLHFNYYQDLIWYKNLILMALVISMFWCALFFRVQADKEYISAKRQWDLRSEW